MEKEGRLCMFFWGCDEIIEVLFLEIRHYFCKIVKEEQDVSVGVAAIRTLMEIIKHYKCMLQTIFNYVWTDFYVVAETLQGLRENLKEGIEIMKNTDYPVAAINSGCELFLRFITLASLDMNVIHILFCWLFCNYNFYSCSPNAKK